MLFEPLVATLGQRVTTRVVSYPTDRDLGYEELEKIARDALPEEGPFILLGESFSGPVAVSLAAVAGPGLKGLILCCSFVRSPRRVGAWLKKRLLFPPPSFLPQAAIDYFLLGRFRNPALSASIRSAISRVSPHVLRRRLKAVLEVDVADKLKSTEVPILYLRATRDRLVPPPASVLVKRLAPQTDVVEIEAPHCLLQAVPGEAAGAIMRFADKFCEGR